MALVYFVLIPALRNSNLAYRTLINVINVFTCILSHGIIMIVSECVLQPKLQYIKEQWHLLARVNECCLLWSVFK